ncbi:unnamed protein product [Pleuronectes platessa]|uniref:Uncharacterized protein n=1 Tax=Pleuronectes platessa TaxID=8262 RepID=A0A9N7UIQ3_PLEPL|nr:unnamed protein product [Pleuronectes platessa]
MEDLLPSAIPYERPQRDTRSSRNGQSVRTHKTGMEEYMGASRFIHTLATSAHGSPDEPPPFVTDRTHGTKMTAKQTKKHNKKRGVCGERPTFRSPSTEQAMSGQRPRQEEGQLNTGLGEVGHAHSSSPAG